MEPVYQHFCLLLLLFYFVLLSPTQARVEVEIRLILQFHIESNLKMIQGQHADQQKLRNSASHVFIIWYYLK